MRLAVLTALLASGCGHLYHKRMMVSRMLAVATDHELVCFQLDSAQIAWGGTSVAMSSLAAGATALTPVFDNKIAQYTLAGGSVVFTVIAALGVYVRDADVKRFNDQCTKPGATP